MRQQNATRFFLGMAAIAGVLLAGNAALLWPVLTSAAFRPLVMPACVALLPMLVAFQAWQIVWSAGIWKRRRFGVGDLLVLITGHAILLCFLRLLWDRAVDRFFLW